MLISKFDLYKSEWLELVFDNRNKAYGAYELRQHSGRTTATAMAIAFTVVLTGALAAFIFTKPIVSASPPVTITPVVIHPYIVPPAVVPPKPITHIAPHVAPPASTATPHIFVPLVISPVPATTEPPKVSELTGPITSTLSKLPGTNTIDEGGKGATEGTATSGPSNEPVSIVGLQQMPEPYGGAGAWSKFLQRNLRYPDMATDQHAQGRVYVSFIVEKDGHLSNIVVDRGAGYGMDEEAVRVLKLAPAWKPGIQNGQPVRVKYTLPINFILGDDQ